MSFLLLLCLFQYKEPVGRFKQHKAPITSVEWSPHETTTMIASGEDNQVTIWDLSLEADSAEDIVDVPQQLLFTHMGQKEVKEVTAFKKFANLSPKHSSLSEDMGSNHGHV